MNQAVHKTTLSWLNIKLIHACLFIKKKGQFGAVVLGFFTKWAEPKPKKKKKKSYKKKTCK